MAINVRVGPAVQIYTQVARAAKDANYFDGVFGVWSQSGASFTANAMTGTDGGTNETLVTTGPIGDIANTASLVAVGSPPAGTSYMSGGPTVVVSGSTLAMVVHCEKWPAGGAGNFWSLLAIARSTDNGATWTCLGTLLTLSYAYDAAAVTNFQEIEQGAFAPMGLYYYLYFREYTGAVSFTDSYLSVARCLITDFNTAILAGTVPTFDKWQSGTTWGGTTGGNLTTLDPKLVEADVWYDSGVQRLVYVSNYNAAYPGGAVYTAAMFSSDGITWTQFTRIAQDAELPNYNSLVPQTLRANRTGTGPWTVVYGAGTRWTAQTIQSRTLTLDLPMPLFYDRVLETTTTTGTGTLTLAGAVAGYQTFGAVGNANTCQYYIEAVDANGIPTGDWEVGVGTYTVSGTTLSRTKILASSNSGAAVNLSAGTKRVGLSALVAAASVPVNSDFGGRLTLETGVAVSTTDQLAKGHLFYTPYLHNRTPKWDGSTWERVTFTEYDLTLTLTSGKVYDVFWDGSALTLSSAWTNTTTRADALSTQDGVPCLGSDHTKLLVGTIYASGTDVTADSGGNAGTTQVGATRYVWNRYNQVPRNLKVRDTTDSWNYSTNTIRQANGAAGNKVSYVTGDAASLIIAKAVGTLYTGGIGFTSTAAASNGVGIDSTTTMSGFLAGAFVAGTGAASGNYVTPYGEYQGYPGLGKHDLDWNEAGDASATANALWIGDNGGNLQCGLWAWMLN